MAQQTLLNGESLLTHRTKLNDNFTELYATSSGSLVVSLTDEDNATYIYYGGLVGTAWKINRYSRATYVKTSATVSNNSTVTTLSAAWAVRSSTLVFA